jgi:hypothetical protein
MKRRYRVSKIGICRPIMRSITIVALFSVLAASSAVAQSGGMYIYPAKGQNKNKQDEDRYDCHSWAVSQTGFDPSKPQRMATSPERNSISLRSPMCCEAAPEGPHWAPWAAR